MTQIEIVEFWANKAKEELVSAQIMLDAGRYLYMGFMCQQSIEKAMKAYFIFLYDEIHPQTHSLNALAKKTKLDEKMQDSQKETLKKLDPLYINTRYEDYKNDVSSLLTAEYCKVLFKETEDLCLWIMELLK